MHDARRTAETLLLALQHGDSFFPGGAFAFSHGLETLAEEGKLRKGSDLGAYLESLLRLRWATCDRVGLARAHRAGPDLPAVAAVDRQLDRLTWAREAREGSRRQGNALLGVHVRLGTPRAGTYARLVAEGAATGQLAAVQGMLFAALGLPLAAAELLAAHAFLVGALGAALRLGLTGHVGAQATLAGLRPVVLDLVAAPVADGAEPSGFAPLGEIATMRHETRASRLFAS